MIDLRKAAEMALDALENHTAIKHPQQIAYRDEAIQALRQALAEGVVQEFKLYDDGINISQERVDKTVKSEHELTDWEAVAADQAMTIAMLKLEKREWVGLKDADIAETMRGNVEGSNMLPYSFARAIEAKLKEKNA